MVRKSAFMKNLSKPIKKLQFQDNQIQISVLDLFRNELHEILTIASNRRKSILLANLLTKIEHYYKLSAIREIFEHETDQAVKELYWEVVKARKFI